MSINLKHLKVSTIPDTSDPTLIQGSDWNADHVLTCASGVVLGRTTAGTGTVDELPLSGLPITGGSIDGTPIGATTPASGVFTTLTGNITCSFGKGSANYLTADGAATTYTPIHAATGSDTNVSLGLKSQGTGAITLAAGSKGAIVSNGGTVTAITRTAAGSGYTTAPTVTIAPPTTPGGVQATVSLTGIGCVGLISVQTGGSGYVVGDTITVSGGTFTTAAQLFVTGVSAGAITSITSLGGVYSAAPSNPVSVTGGSGSGATLNLTWGVTSNQTLSITNAGSGYLEQPSVTFSGGGGSGAAAYATVGSGTRVQSLGSIFSVVMPGSGEIIRASDTSSAGSYLNVFNSGGSILLRLTSSTSGAVQTSTSVPMQFQTNASATATEQFRVTHTANAVNYLQATGGATGFGTSLTAQGSDTSINLLLASKNSGAVAMVTNGSRQFDVFGPVSSANWIRANGSTAAAAPNFTASGSDTNIDLALIPKGTGVLQFGTYTTLGLEVLAGYITIKDAGGTVRKLAVIA